jgi:hypothetical protein
MRRLTLVVLAAPLVTTNALIITLSPRSTIIFTLSVADDETLLGDEEGASSVSEQGDMFASLKARQDDLEQGIGKRFRVRTQRGFLNVHSTYEDGPYANDNVVNQLEEGQIVTSVSPRVDDWVHHDAGGWSIAMFGGFRWLEPLDEV